MNIKKHLFYFVLLIAGTACRKEPVPVPPQESWQKIGQLDNVVALEYLHPQGDDIYYMVGAGPFPIINAIACYNVKSGTIQTKKLPNEVNRSYFTSSYGKNKLIYTEEKNGKNYLHFTSMNMNAKDFFTFSSDSSLFTVSGVQPWRLIPMQTDANTGGVLACYLGEDMRLFNFQLSYTSDGSLSKVSFDQGQEINYKFAYILSSGRKFRCFRGEYICMDDDVQSISPGFYSMSNQGRVQLLKGGLEYPQQIISDDDRLICISQTNYLVFYSTANAVNWAEHRLENMVECYRPAFIGNSLVSAGGKSIVKIDLTNYAVSGGATAGIGTDEYTEQCFLGADNATVYLVTKFFDSGGQTLYYVYKKPLSDF